MNFPILQPVEAAVTLSMIWIGLGVIALAFYRAPRFITSAVFPAGALVSLALAATGMWALGAPPSAAILLAFGVLHGGHGDYTFDALRAAELGSSWAKVAFLLAFFGFGAKAGMLPLHVWLPEAHPDALAG